MNSSKIKILYYANCWFTNVGEAFIDFGADNLIKKIFAEQKICLANFSSMTEIYHGLSNVRNTNELYCASRDLNADYVVLAGMFATTRILGPGVYLKLKELKEKGSKVVILGLGGEKYTEEEKNEFKKFLVEIEPELIMTRDYQTYETYKDYGNVISGLDVALWLKDTYDPRGFSNTKYDVVTFNRTAEPTEFKEWKNNIVRPKHFQWSYDYKSEKCSNVMISDVPYDYVTLYANANNVYTDLVHATLICLQYGIPVKYYYVDKRSYAFEAIKNIYTQKGFLLVEEELLEKQKEEIVKQIQQQLF